MSADIIRNRRLQSASIKKSNYVFTASTRRDYGKAKRYRMEEG
jgi:hypothetical protein